MDRNERTVSEFYSVQSKGTNGEVQTVRNIPYKTYNFNVDKRVKFLTKVYMPQKGLREFDFTKWDGTMESLFIEWEELIKAVLEGCKDDNTRKLVKYCIDNKGNIGGI
ncbi:putative DNA ligase [Bacillus phage BCP8-2]|uniref:Putative DNA ligase n=1 Tax=Bacillus phage BCP8-2 TaxID=1129192 RepID=A0A0E3D9R5_9CAUD|nr:putative DNA ligase [Bacillus phage BCP8-2]AHJ87113.1 putative DNA ligase [Bacillus phage BCP8-2]